ncbi:MAG TPA: tetratricopeptide repeat protein [Candidatus Binataceae bacterium]|nr:tetratricopeptide repeat protein [Candidatus Binataceae bacterium]
MIARRHRLLAISRSGMMVWGMDIGATKHRGAARKIHSMVLLLPMITVLGCANAAIDANRRQVEQNQALIEQSQKQIAMLKAQQNNPPPTPAGTGACDKGVEATATHRGGDALASGDMTKALGYYQDALTACPNSSKADMNLARVYETLDNRDAAIRYYEAAASTKQSDGNSAKDAQAALTRLGVH